MDNQYPTLDSFIKRNDLITNQKITNIVLGNLLSNNFLFQNIESNLLFLSLSENADNIAIALKTINYVELDNGEIWDKNTFNYCNNLK